MIIGIDGHDLEGHRTGVGQYLMAILRAWARAGVLAQERIIVFAKDRVPEDLPAGITARRLVKPLGHSSTALFIQALLPRAAKRAGIDVLWCPGYIAPLWLPRRHRETATMSVPSTDEGLPSKIPLVLTLHDIIYEARPELFNWRGPQDFFLLKFVSRAAAKRAARILAPSQFTASEVRRLYQVPEQRIAVTPEATDSAFQPISNKDALAVAARYGIRESYFFFVGSMFTRRRIPECLQAFGAIARDFPRQQFLLAGGNYTRPHMDIHDMVAQLNAAIGRPAIIAVPYAAQEDLPSLMSGAAATIWLSEYEGFGLPPLESLACGTPVITTASASLPETVGDCALFVRDPSNVTMIAEAMRVLLSDAELRNRLSACGPRRAAQFSWDRCAAQTLAVIRQAAKEYAA